MYDFFFNTQWGLAALFFGGMVIFAVLALLLERGTRSKYRDRPKPTEDVTFKKSNRPVKTKAERERERAEQVDEVRGALAEGGIAGLLGISFDDDEEK